MPTKYNYLRLKALHRCQLCGKKHDSPTDNCDSCRAKIKEKYSRKNRPTNINCKDCGNLVPTKPIGSLPLRCTSCNTKAQLKAAKERRHANLPHYKKYAKERMRRIRKQDPEKYINQQLRNRYDIGFSDYLEILISQSNSCGICRNPIPDILKLSASERRLIHVDHNHTTQKVRGILCNKCNLAIGLLKDDPIIILAAYKYISNTQ